MITPYGAAKIVNARLEKEGLSKRVRPQMMYNYTKARLNNGEKPFIEFDEKNGVNEKSLNEWIDKYVAKQLNNTTHEVSDPEQAAFDFAEAN